MEVTEASAGRCLTLSLTRTPTLTLTPTPTLTLTPTPALTLTRTLTRTLTLRAGIQVGAAVLARWLDGRYYPASIAALLPDGCYRIHFDDGDVAPSVPSQVDEE